MPTIIVGEAKVQATWLEYFASILPLGTAVEYEMQKLNNDVTKGVGILAGRYWYDGVNARIEHYGGGIVFISCNWKGNKIRRLRDFSKLAATGCGGDGI